MNNLMKLVILICMFVIFSGCTEETVKPNNPTHENPILMEHNGQQFEIYTFFEEYENFVDKAEKEPSNIEALFNQEVKKAFAINSNHTISLYEEIPAPKKLEQIREYLEKLKSNKQEINKWIQEALEESSDRLSGVDKTIYVFPSFVEEEASLKDLDYVAGGTFGKEHFYLKINPSFTELALKYTVAHEYHHTVAMESGDATTLLERCILEGKADTFAKIIYPQMEPVWQQPLSGYYEEQGWKVFKENLESEESEIWDFLFVGNHFKGIAKWTNYKIGYEIMRSFLEKNHDVSTEEWTKMSAQEILAKSKYVD
ncbi:DUF2268 domain-containing putative Zn-dependent protease [Psychrobacillus sp. FSL K6-2684]|uniref:DUF2268 domain-containing protein n=1 Tax=Psychrobacillus sp. FSL K6-2684 TaxID=2921547 RepID=UPI0030FCF3BA